MMRCVTERVNLRRHKTSAPRDSPSLCLPVIL